MGETVVEEKAARARHPSRESWCVPLGEAVALFLEVIGTLRFAALDAALRDHRRSPDTTSYSNRVGSLDHRASTPARYLRHESAPDFRCP